MRRWWFVVGWPVQSGVLYPGRVCRLGPCLATIGIDDSRSAVVAFGQFPLVINLMTCLRRQHSTETDYCAVTRLATYKRILLDTLSAHNTTSRQLGLGEIADRNGSWPCGPVEFD